jgi:hypothetical protein
MGTDIHMYVERRDRLTTRFSVVAGEAFTEAGLIGAMRAVPRVGAFADIARRSRRSQGWCSASILSQTFYEREREKTP